MHMFSIGETEEIRKMWATFENTPKEQSSAAGASSRQMGAASENTEATLNQLENNARRYLARDPPNISIEGDTRWRRPCQSSQFSQPTTRRSQHQENQAVPTGEGHNVWRATTGYRAASTLTAEGERKVERLL